MTIYLLKILRRLSGIGLVFCICSGTALAGELHSFLLDKCQLETGIIVSATEEEVVLINTQGRERSLTPAEIKSVFVFNYFENPILRIQVGPRLKEAARQVTVNGDVFIGWPVRFVESLVMFYDTRGRIRVHERDSIEKIRPVAEAITIDSLSGKALELDLKDLSTECSGLPAGGTDSTRPTRIMSDQIKIEQYLSDLRRGYHDLQHYQERTYLYARPFLFDRETRFALVIAPDEIERKISFPMAYQWSSGTPFHFQSFNRFGFQTSEFGPYALGFFGFRSDLKAHVFHAHFSGDFQGLAGGQSIYDFYDTEEDADDFGGASEVQTGMNYLLLMGGDYGPLTISAGYYYPVHLLRAGTTTREVLASSKNYAYRVMWTTSNMRFRVLFSPNKFKAASPDEDDLLTDDNSTHPDRFKFNGTFLRAGWDWDWSRERQISVDVLLNEGDFTEKAGGVESSFSFHRRGAILSVRQDFGDYVGLRLNTTWLEIETEYQNFGGLTKTRKISPFLIGGQIEFIF